MIWMNCARRTSFETIVHCPHFSSGQMHRRLAAHLALNQLLPFLAQLLKLLEQYRYLGAAGTHTT